MAPRIPAACDHHGGGFSDDNVAPSLAQFVPGSPYEAFVPGTQQANTTASLQYSLRYLLRLAVMLMAHLLFVTIHVVMWLCGVNLQTFGFTMADGTITALALRLVCTRLFFSYPWTLLADWWLLSICGARAPRWRNAVDTVAFVSVAAFLEFRHWGYLVYFFVLQSWVGFAASMLSKHANGDRAITLRVLAFFLWYPCSPLLLLLTDGSAWMGVLYIAACLSWFTFYVVAGTRQLYEGSQEIKAISTFKLVMIFLPAMLVLSESLLLHNRMGILDTLFCANTKGEIFDADLQATAAEL
ncbi:unnamed protein product [Vitrella brassicaformis CCMP3155]|uniref:Uncharacterized protein n=2 Tax=Vitrella brassicaformis TaxID=1169539 RepID=A0A0G4GT20_VITBC|nr:unnamed protein product [Vitrella brassicaformis CCMP3155]|eukprot:CEM33841.1 unnamed protein product [Vitrella brassicaformis CCMP3155]